MVEGISMILCAFLVFFADDHKKALTRMKTGFIAWDILIKKY